MFGSNQKHRSNKNGISVRSDRLISVRFLRNTHLEEKIAYTINFFKELGEIITRDEAIDIINHVKNLPAYKQYQAEIQPLIKKQVYLEKELESAQSMIDEETAKLRELEKLISKLKP